MTWSMSEHTDKSGQMRALFLIPPVDYGTRSLPVDRVYGCNYGFDLKPPIHLLQVATTMRERAGWDVQLMDCPAEGVDAEQFERFIGENQFDVICHWAVYLSAVEDVTAAHRIERLMPGAQRFVFMGSAATWRPNEMRVNEETYCLLGEPEETLLELDAAWRGEGELTEILGLGWWDAAGELQRGEFRPLLDVSALPMPDRTLLKGRYWANRLPDGPVTTLVVSRGCGFRCTFCCTNAVDQAIELEYKRLQPVYVDRPPLRKRTVDQIVAEFENIAALGYKSVEIADNIFTWGKSRTIEICDRIAPLGLKWVCLARANMLHDVNMIRAMARAGCQLIYMGSESFDDGLLDDMMKELKVRDVVKAVETCREGGVEPEVSVLMGGSPNETWRSLLHSVRAARRLDTKFVHFSVALPSPSTELYDQALAEGWFIEGDYRPADNQQEVIVDLPHLSARQLTWAIKVAYATKYLHPRAIFTHASTVKTADDFRDRVKSASRLFGFLTGRSKSSARVRIPPGRVTPEGLERSV